MIRATLAAVPLALAACADPEPRPTFNSQLEERCYDQANAALGPNRTLERDSAGNFVEVFSTDGFVRDIDPSEVFDSCMTRESGGSPANVGTITFTAEELEVWRGLSDEARRDAVEYIRRGGTLSELYDL